MLKLNFSLSKTNKSPSLTIVLIIVFTICHLLVIGTFPSKTFSLFAAKAQTCSTNLDLAEENYHKGNFDGVIELVRKCLEDTKLSRVERLRAYKILSRTLLAKNNKKGAKEIIGKIIKISPTFEPTIEQETPQFVNLVAEVKEEKRKSKKKSIESSKSNWLWIGAGSVAATAIVVLLVSGSENNNGSGNGEQSLPKPPEFP